MKEIPPRRRPILHRGARLTRRGPLLSFAGDRRSHRRDRSNPARSGARSAKLRSASALRLPSRWTHNVYVNGASRGTGSPSSWASAAPSSLRDRFPPPLAGLASRVNGLGRWHEDADAIGPFFVAKPHGTGAQIGGWEGRRLPWFRRGGTDGRLRRETRDGSPPAPRSVVSTISSPAFAVRWSPNS